MAALQGTILASKIVPTDSLDTYATHEDKYGRGGHRSVDTIVERDGISPERRKEGMTVYVKSTKVKYVLEGGLTNEFWLPEASGGSIDLSNYYKKLETYSKAQVDALVAGGGADLSDYYKKAEVESLISAIPATDLTNYYDKTQVDSLIPNISTKQDTLVSATNIKTINGESVLGSGDIVISSGGAVDSVAGKTGVVTLVKGDVGLNNVDNTSDTNKPISTATQTALNSKVDKVAGKGLSTEDYTTAEKTKLTGLSNYTKPASEPISYITGLQTALDSKVSKTGIETLHSTDALRISGTTLSLYKGDGTFESVVTQDTVYTLPKASETVLGGIKVGTNLSIDANGVLSANDTNVSFTEISNKPTNLSGYGITDAYTKTQVDSLIPNISTKQDVLVSGTSVKTINGESVLGSGNIVIIDEGSVQLTGNQTVDGVKTFSSSIVGDITGNAATTTKLKTPVKINGIDFDGSVDITIEAGGSGSSTFTGTAAIDIGGVKVGDSWDNAPISDVVNAIINPELFPTFVNPTFSFTSTVNGFREVGSVTDITFNVNFSRGSITPQYSAENNYRSGLPTTYNYSGPVGSEAKANNTLTDTKTITGYSIAIGSNTFFCSVDYSIGTQPKSSKGNNFNTPLPAGALAAKSVTITGVYPVYSGIGTLSKIPLQAHGTAIVVDAPADMNVGGNRFTIHYPNVWSAKTPVIQQENELSKAWDNQNMLEYKIADINISGVPYKQVKYVGSGIGIRKLRLMF